ncbi:hypothetical protein H8S37_04765 [Mediterraneibacter sp. NSJ-55]|uniref:Fibronectin type-III domain-containing protein n=1 Tax=Mediterraneibacter hominis TaxID=2763054 RepID=A0A923LGK2_9FIRM|nr:hypothetical protein [Mediterraneibacter hominis]MBC5688241.1 hypothetical protein [Mediterraneibacter hominis]
MATWESRVTCSETYVSGGAENYSNVTITFQIRRMDYSMNGYNYEGTANWSIACNGSHSGNQYFNFNWGGTPAGTWWTVGSYSFKIPHNSDGSKTISYSAYFYTGITPESFSASGSKTLTKIPRYAKITTFKVTSTTQTGATVTWNTDATCNALYYSLNNGSWKSISVAKTFSLSGLAPGTSYTLKIRVKRSDSGLTTDSSNTTFSTLPIATISTYPITFNIGSPLVLTFQNYNNNASFLRLYQKNTSDSWVKITEVTGIQQSSYTWNLSSFATTMYNNTPNSNTSDIKIICGVVLNEKEYTNEYLGTANVVNSNPSFTTFVFGNTEEMSSEMLGSTLSMITYVGNLRVSISTANKAIAKNGASISYYNISVSNSNGDITILKKVNETTSNLAADFGNFQTAGSYSIKVEAVDSRGNISNLVTKNFVVYKYHTPTITVTLTRVNNFEKETGVTILAYLSRVYTTANKNALSSLKYRFREQGGGWSSYFTLSPSIATSNDDFKITYTHDLFRNLEIQKAYEFEFVITDKIQAVTSMQTVGQGVPLMTIADSGTVLVNEIPTMENLENDCSFLVGSDILARDSLGTQRKILEEITNKITFSETIEAEPQNTMNDTIWCPILATITLSSE